MDKKSKYGRIATQFNSAEKVLEAIGSRKLQGSESQRPELREGYVAPRTVLERFLAGKWQEMFGIDEMGVYDNFFELGIDSIKAAVYLNNLQQEMGETVYVVTLFDSPTIADLAIYLIDQYPEAVSRVCGPESIDDGHHKEAAHDSERAPQVDAAKVAQLRRPENMLEPASETSTVEGSPIATAQPSIRPVSRKNKNLNQFLEELKQLSDDDVRVLLENERR
jgi:aryl carrier-like protein